MECPSIVVPAPTNSAAKGDVSLTLHAANGLMDLDRLVNKIGLVVRHTVRRAVVNTDQERV